MGDTAATIEYIVTGMTCQHCVSAVSQGIGAIVGVTDVQVDLAAVDEAGYEMSG
ncbi:MAG: heavy-metal-associated domain-containing protein [Pseudonocardiaceae bacterium]